MERRFSVSAPPKLRMRVLLYSISSLVLLVLIGDTARSQRIIPFGKGQCEYTYDGRLICSCMHGPTECDLNRLQNCAIAYFPRRHLGLVTCIQGLANLDEAFQRCLSRLSPKTQQKLMECAKTQIGEVLNYYSMINTHRAGIRIWPTAYVNGFFFDRSYPMENEICRHTDYC